MRWSPPWAHGSLGAGMELESTAIDPFAVRIIGVDKREVESARRQIENIVYADGGSIQYTEDHMDRIRPSIAKKYGFPPEFFGKMAFYRGFVVSGATMDSLANIGRLTPGSLVRIELK